ncbi:hypothetical protein EP7_003843 [Isosphaeraceae bacterium EP7]
MDRRDPTPSGATEGRPGDGFRRRFSGLSRPAGVRHIARARLIAAILLGLALFVALFAGGSRGLAGIRAWLHGQDTYQIRFDEIELTPKPPPWIQSGARGILESVQRDGHWNRPISLLDPAEPENLYRSFALDSPWVERVVRVEPRFPRQLTVELRYREPVAYVSWKDPTENYVIDGDAVILPLDDLDRTATGPLPRIVTQTETKSSGPPNEVPRPYERKPGYPWKSPPDEADRPNSTAVAKSGSMSPQLGAARMAALLRTHREDADKIAPTILMIFPDEGRGIFLSTADGTTILWGEAPGDERPGSHDAATKWRFLQEWVSRQGTLSLSRPDFLIFGRHGLRPNSEPDSPAPAR